MVSILLYHDMMTSLTHCPRLQGVDIPDVLVIVQWRAPKDLNILIQCFGCAAQDFSLQAVAILIAEPRWFLEEDRKEQACKRK
jgi:hypothetical protein